MNPSREYLQACSIQTGYQITPLWKVVNVRNYLAGQSKKKKRSPGPGGVKGG